MEMDDGLRLDKSSVVVFLDNSDGKIDCSEKLKRTYKKVKLRNVRVQNVKQTFSTIQADKKTHKFNSNKLHESLDMSARLISIKLKSMLEDMMQYLPKKPIFKTEEHGRVR